MFQLEAFVDDKNVHKVLWALDGLVLEGVKLIPVRGAKAKKDRVVSTQPVKGGYLSQQVMALIANNKWQTINTAQFRDVCEQAGAAKGSVNTLRKNLRKNGFLSHEARGAGKGAGTGARTYRVN